jgi:hypothetical protein
MAIALVLLVALVTSFGGDANRAMPSWAQSVRQGADACRSKEVGEATVFITPEVGA